jgi:signal transduction histidine kinase
MAFYSGDRIPPRMARYGPGSHEYGEGDVTVHVLVVTDAQGVRHAAVDRVPDFELIEREIVIALALGIVLSVALAALLGRMTAGRVIAPLTALAEGVSRDQVDPASGLLARGDEIGLLARAFAAHNAEQHGFLERERRFSGDASHELRTPLTVIAGASELLAARLADRPDLAPALERIRRATDDMTDRVAALLTLSRAPDAIALDDVPLLPLLQREAERCRPLLAGKDVALDVQAAAPVIVRAHAGLAAMAIGNLLRNACHYTERGRIVARLEGQRLVVEDSGPGLPAAVRDRLFERQQRTAAEGGAGFGLALVHRIAEHLGWRIAYEARAEGGSRFVLSFGAA